MTVPIGTPAYPITDSSPANTKWEDLPHKERMRDSVINGPVAAIAIYSLLMVKRDSKQERRDLHDKITKELDNLAGLFNEHCREPRHNLRFWERSWWPRASR